MTMNNRHYLNDLLDKLNLSINAFEKEIGAGTGTISKIINGTEERELSIKTIRKIVARYPELSPSWLQTGEGPMLLTTTDKVRVLRRETGEPHEEKGIFSKVAGLFKKIPQPDKEDLMTFNEIVEWEEDLLRRYEELKKKNQDKKNND